MVCVCTSVYRTCMCMRSRSHTTPPSDGPIMAVGIQHWTAVSCGGVNVPLPPFDRTPPPCVLQRTRTRLDGRCTRAQRRARGPLPRLFYKIYLSYIVVVEASFLFHFYFARSSSKVVHARYVIRTRKDRRRLLSIWPWGERPNFDPRAGLVITAFLAPQNFTYTI